VTRGEIIVFLLGLVLGGAIATVFWGAVLGGIKRDLCRIISRLEKGEK